MKLTNKEKLDLNRDFFEKLIKNNISYFQNPVRYINPTQKNFMDKEVGYRGETKYLSKGESIFITCWDKKYRNNNPTYTITVFIKEKIIETKTTFFGKKVKIEKGEFKKSFFLGKKIKGNFVIDPKDEKLFSEIKKYSSDYENLVKSKILEKEKKKSIKENQRLKDLDLSQSKVLSELDKDGNGIIDVIESDDFMKLFRKHQSVIKEFDKEYINHLVKISNYLKTKRSNIQEIFLEIRKTKNQSQLEENVGLLKNQIHTYEVVLFHSLSMITSIVEDDLITVNEIYEEFDKLKMFKTDHEKEVSQKLSDIGDGLSTLMYSINSMERNIVSGLNTLIYITEDGFLDLNNSLSRELQSIDSSIQSNNLLNTIQTYQLYKINKQTKGLIG